MGIDVTRMMAHVMRKYVQVRYVINWFMQEKTYNILSIELQFYTSKPSDCMATLQVSPQGGRGNTPMSK